MPDGVLGRIIQWGGSQRRVLAAMAAVGILTLLVKLVATAKDVAVARAFGTSDVMDAFLIAFLLPSFAIAVVAGAVPPALIPIYVRVREREGEHSARELLSVVILYGLGLLLLVTILLAALAPHLLPLLGSGFDDPKLRITRVLFLLLLPAILLNGLSAVGAAALNAGDRYLLASFAPVLTPAAIVLVLLYPHSWGIFALVVGTLLGMLLEVLVLGQSLLRRALLIVPRLRRPHPALALVGQQYLPAVVGAAVMSSAGLIDQSMAASLGPGSVSFLSYGSKLVLGLLSIGVVALATPILPLFSRLVEARDWTGMTSAIRSFAKLVLVVTIPGTLLLVWWSEEVVRLLFERGAFGPSDTLMVSRVQMMYALQAPFYILSIIGVRLLSALGRNRLIMWVSIVNLAINVVGNLVLMRYLGVVGIALSTSIVYVLSCVMIFTLVRRSLK